MSHEKKVCETKITFYSESGEYTKYVEEAVEEFEVTVSHLARKLALENKLTFDLEKD